ncbi:hypothetical protein PG993_007951 [Apiospora rasikravindrae]|uniref:DUF4419 domain-containing protein n=1 Tax=Apiospora rasikravindrae TaxID=990691 RepID=A0ABR1SYY2_9PEZI
MPVKIRPSSHRAKPIRSHIEEEEFATSPTQILTGADHGYRSEEDRGDILTSSFGPNGDELNQLPDGDMVLASKNGLITAAAEAYCEHHHLVIRPEDIWIAITTQLRFYIKGHAEELRHLMVPHEGRKELEVKVGSLEKARDVPYVVQQFEGLLEKNVLDPSLVQWFLPDFSTTTPDDVTVASIVAMGAYSAFFNFWVSAICGIPSVTLLGERADYEKILQRLDRLCEFGEEPTRFCAQLRPILRRCMRSFDAPEDDAIKEFWNNICTMHTLGCGGDHYYTGWITAFGFWQPDGKKTAYHGIDRNRFGKTKAMVEMHQWMTTGVKPEAVDLGLTYDGVTYDSIDRTDLPSGFSKVPIVLSDMGNPVAKMILLAGSVAIGCSKSGEMTTDGDEALDTVRPQLGWFMYEKKGVSLDKHDD